MPKTAQAKSLVDTKSELEEVGVNSQYLTSDLKTLIWSKG